MFLKIRLEFISLRPLLSMGGWVGGKEAGSLGLSLMAAANKKALFWVQST